jgi:hypothetical protein
MWRDTQNTNALAARFLIQYKNETGTYNRFFWSFVGIFFTLGYALLPPFTKCLFGSILFKKAMQLIIAICILGALYYAQEWARGFKRKAPPKK